MKYSKNKSEPPAHLGTIAKMYWREGYQANRLYVDRKSVPYNDTMNQRDWQAGWDQAEKDYENETCSSAS